MVFQNTVRQKKLESQQGSGEGLSWVPTDQPGGKDFNVDA